MATTLHQLFLGFFLFVMVARLVSQDIAHPLDHNTTFSLAMMERHEKWMAQYGVVYKNASEKRKRFLIFKENLKRVNKFNSREASKSYKRGTNAFTDLTTEEFLATHTGSIGHLPQQTKLLNLDENVPNINLSNVPNSIDWRKEGAVTPIKSQQHCGACWAFAVVAAFEGLFKIKTGTLASFSEQNLIDCVEENQGCSGGSQEYAYKFMATIGIEQEKYYPYRDTQGECKFSDFVITPLDFHSWTGGTSEVLMAFVSQQPVSIRIDAKGFGDYSSGVYDGGCSKLINHSMTIIGYDTDNETGKKYWLLKNSWGTSWGEDGYMKLLIDENLCPILTGYCFPTMG